jgi:dienelactone hydrolase
MKNKTGWGYDDDFPFTAQYTGGRKATHHVYVKGSGKPILLLQELPGLDRPTFDLIDRLASEGFRVYALHFLGPFGVTSVGGNLVRVLCMRAAFHLFRSKSESPIAGYFRALARHIRDRENVTGIGVVGMCLTGSFAITMMADDAVLGGVASQPALPLAGGAKLPMSDDDIVAARLGMTQKGPALAMRYQGDAAVPKSRFCAYAQAFEDGLELHEIEGKGHSILTHDLHPASLDKVIQYLKDRI